MQKYNTQLPNITLPEYGRNLQQLIQYCKTIPERDKRTAYAYTIVDVMADLYPEIANVEDGKHVLWDHLALISDFELDIDYPYQMIKKDDFQTAPTPIIRDNKPTRLKIYGKVVEQMVKKAVEMENVEERAILFTLCANHMKRNFHLVNKDADEDDEKIKYDLVGFAGMEYRDEIAQLNLGRISELMKNEQYDSSKLVEPKKKKKKKK